jgi:hypothetical protein
MGLVLAGCDAAALQGYQGEPLEALAGTIQGSLAAPPPAADLLLLWINWRTAPGTVVGTRVPVTGSFPAGFSLDIFLPPPAEALNALPPDSSATIAEPDLGFAWIMVVRSGATPPGRDILFHQDVKGLSTGDVLGWAENYVLAYLDRDAVSGSWAEAALSGPLGRGYHLMRVEGTTQANLIAIGMCKAQMGGTSANCKPTLAPLSEVSGTDGGLAVDLSSDLSTLLVPLFQLPPKVEQSFGITYGG